MELWNFSNIPFLTLFIICLVVIVFIIGLIASFIYSLVTDTRIAEQIIRETNVVRVLNINPKENRVVYFDRTNLKVKRVMSLTKFFNSFHEGDVEKVKNWIYSMYIDHKDVDEYIEADMITNHGKNNYFSILRLLKFDSNAGLIHVESHLFRYITPNNFVSKKPKHISKSYGLVDPVAYSDMINERKSIKGFTYAIRFYYLKPLVTTNEKIERFMVLSLKNNVYPFALDQKHCRQIIDNKDNQILLFDLNIDSKERAILLANSIEKSMRKAIVINGFQDSINFTIGIVENNQYFQDFEGIIEASEQACFYAQQNNQTIYLFKRSSSRPLIDLNKINEHVEYLLKPNSLRYLYRPIVDINTASILGYFEYIKAYESPLGDFLEMANYAAKVDKNRELFSVVSKMAITEFVNSVKNKKYKLFFAVSLLDIKHIKELLSTIVRIKECDLVLIFDEEEINDNVDGYDVLTNIYKDLRDEGYSLALSLKSRDLLLDSSFYLNFDFFVVGSSMIGEIKQSGRTRLSVHVLIEQLLKYNKPIIATDLDGWQAIELLIQSGISVISSENITASNDMILPVDKKKMDRLSALAEKYK